MQKITAGMKKFKNNIIEIGIGIMFWRCAGDLFKVESGARYKIWTCDHLHVMEALYRWVNRAFVEWDYILEILKSSHLP